MNEVRSFYLDDFADECIPCDATREGWAEWLSKPDREWRRPAPADDGQSFTGCATRWEDDIVATRDESGWSLSRSADAYDFAAVRYGFGSGWSPESIVSPTGGVVHGVWVETQTMTQALLAFLDDESNGCDDEEYIAVGYHESGWRFTYEANPPVLLAERAQ